MTDREDRGIDRGTEEGKRSMSTNDNATETDPGIDSRTQKLL